MQDHTQFSPEALRIITRLARNLRELDDFRTPMTDKHAVLRLLHHALQDSRPEITEPVAELKRTLKPTEVDYLRQHGLDLGETRASTETANEATPPASGQRVYRGQVVAEDAAAPAQSEPKRRVYRGQVIQE